MTRPLEALQPIGRALMLPIAVLPIAALLLRVGQPDLLGIAFVSTAGQAIFDHLGLLFAAGVAVGLAEENHGAAALAGIVAYLVATEGAKPLLAVPAAALPAGGDPAWRDLAAAAWRGREIGKLSVPAGIVAGLMAGALYNRFHAIRLPAALGFFGGRRFVPIAAGLAGIGLALAFGAGFPLFEAGVDALSHWVAAAGLLGLFLYGLFNRLLLVTGLHHILNNLVWFVLGDFHGKSGDLNRFFAGDPTAGGFMAGFFPVMMFGLPAACLAMYRAAPPGRRRGVAGLYLGLALTSFLTGVTEPIEFTFMFLAPVLFAIHAVLTGAAMVVMAALGVKLGFGFSAGLLDYVLGYGLATRPLLLLPVGVAYAAIYYAAFSWGIRRFDLKTPGRDADPVADAGAPAAIGSMGERAALFVAALGGAGNLRTVAACTTRLRLSVADPAAIDRPALAALGARGVLDLGGGSIQVVVGVEADQLAHSMRAGSAAPVMPAPDEPAPAATGGSDAERTLAEALGRQGARTAIGRGRRLVIRGSAAPDASYAAVPGVRASARIGSSLHLLVDGNADRIAALIDRGNEAGGSAAG